MFNACKKRQRSEITLNNFVRNQAGFFSLLLIKGQRQMRAHYKEKVASISCHVSGCVSKVHSIKASLTGAFLFLLCCTSNTLYTQLKRVSCFSLNAFGLYVYLFEKNQKIISPHYICDDAVKHFFLCVCELCMTQHKLRGWRRMFSLSCNKVINNSNIYISTPWSLYA